MPFESLCGFLGRFEILAMLSPALALRGSNSPAGSGTQYPLRASSGRMCCSRYEHFLHRSNFHSELAFYVIDFFLQLRQFLLKMTQRIFKNSGVLN
jgi:hypothetical protein